MTFWSGRIVAAQSDLDKIKSEKEILAPYEAEVEFDKTQLAKLAPAAKAGFANAPAAAVAAHNWICDNPVLFYSILALIVLAIVGLIVYCVRDTKPMSPPSAAKGGAKGGKCRR